MGKYTLSYDEPAGAPGLYIGVFPNGMPQEELLREDADDAVAFSVYANTSKRKAQQRLVVGENSAIEYVGQNFGADSLYSRYNKYLVGVVDEKSKTIRLHDAQTFSLKQRVKRVKYADAAEEELEDSRTEYQKAIAAKTSLVESFGARRNLQAIQSAQRNRVDTEAISGISAAISSRLEAHALDTPTVEDTQDQMDADRAIPPCDTDATELADVYKFHELITPDEYEALRQPAKLLVKTTRTDIANWRAKKMYGEYILGHLEDMPSNSAQKNKTARALVYISYLSKLYCNERQLNKEDNGLKGVPVVIRNRLLATFTVKAEGNDDKVEHRMPQKMKDKIVAYIIAIGLHIDGFTVAHEVIGQDLKIDGNKMKNIVKGLGLKLDRSGKAAKLQIPLEFPKINIRKVKS